LAVSAQEGTSNGRVLEGRVRREGGGLVALAWRRRVCRLCECLSVVRMWVWVCGCVCVCVCVCVLGMCVCVSLSVCVCTVELVRLLRGDAPWVAIAGGS